jgi:stage II sporulation protein D
MLESLNGVLLQFAKMPKQPFPYPMIQAIAPVIGLGYNLFAGAVPAAKPTVPFQLAQASQPRMNMARAANGLDVLLAVAIEQRAKTLSIATSTPGQVVDSRGTTLQVLAASQKLTLQPSDRGIATLGGNTPILPNSFWIGASQGGYVWVGSRWYRGRVRIVMQPNGLLAVNHLPLEDYLYSVVGSEMPASWPMEALKAQAVAARSYALVHYLRPASDFFHLGNTQRWQVYKGLDSETSRTQQAVRQTTGQVLSHRGGVVESLYAATQAIVTDVHGGFGMSQHGAKDLAVRGYTYLHILGSYYPGVSLAQLRLKAR